MWKLKKLFLCIIVLFCCTLVLTGCSFGKSSNFWNVGTTVPSDDLTGKIGDMYLNISNYDLYQLNGDGWSFICNIAKGDNSSEVTPVIAINADGYWTINEKVTDVKVDDLVGTNEGVSIKISNDGYLIIDGVKTNVKSEDSVRMFDEDGISIYVGYDGYVWNGNERSGYKLAQWSLADDVVESTLGIEQEMSKHFIGRYVELSNNTIALMSYYKPYAQITQYSGLTISEISVYAEKIGKLQIGTAKVSDVVNARTNGTLYKSNMKSYDVVKGMNTIKLKLNVGEDETIVIGGKGSVGLYYAMGINADDEQGVFSVLNSSNNLSIVNMTNAVLDKLAIQVKTSDDIDIDKHIENLAVEEKNVIYDKKLAKVKKALKNKNISILGDSISTFEGYSDDDTTNSTIGSNEVYYPRSGITNVKQTWWRKLASKTGMKVLVNNAWSGAKVSSNDRSSGYSRGNNLHDNIGKSSGTNPDVIAVYLGINDFNDRVSLGSYDEDLYNDLISKKDGKFTYDTPQNFTEAYIIMMHKIVNKYKDADVYCFTLLPNGKRNNDTLLQQYNDTIRKIAEYYNIGVVDLYNDSGITATNFLEYSNESDGLHPNEKGMDAITDTFIKTLMSKYAN